MTQEMTPIGEMMLVGTVAYRLYSRVYYGRIEYVAEIGRPYTNQKTGVTKIITQMKGSATRDYLAAAQYAAEQLEQLQQAQFKHTVQAATQSVSSLELETEVTAEKPQEELKLKLA